MTEQDQFVPTCPVCAAAELITQSVLEAAEPGLRDVTCQVCGWQGKLSETMAMRQKDRHQWSAEAAAERLSRVFQMRGITAALVRTLQASSVLPELIDTEGLRPEQRQLVEAANASAVLSINNVMRAGLEAFIRASFTAAVEEAVRHQEVLNMLRENASKDDLSPDRVFGGDS